MKRILSFKFIILVVMLVTSCTFTVKTVDTPLYSGKRLSIGVVGEAPNIRENHVSFTNISFNELEKYSKLSAKFNAVFIMSKHLSKAAQSKYAKVYKNSGIPFFFIGSTKSYVPFIYEELSYEDVPDSSNDMYASGFLRLDNENRNWGYGLYNDKVNDPNIKDAYSRIFTTIESIENGIYNL